MRDEETEQRQFWLRLAHACGEPERNGGECAAVERCLEEPGGPKARAARGWVLAGYCLFWWRQASELRARRLATGAVPASRVLFDDLRFRCCLAALAAFAALALLGLPGRRSAVRRSGAIVRMLRPANPVAHL